MSYQIPLADPADPGRPPRQPGRAELLRASAARRLALRRSPRRLAYVDSHFPWRRSGFRYDEALELHRRRPDTLFFSLYALTDPFPAPVHPLHDFPVVAPAAGVTDVSVVFLNLVAGLLGTVDRPGVGQLPGVRSDISIRPWLDRWGIRLHAAVYPGGGLLPTVPAEVVAAATEGAATVFTPVHRLLRELPGCVRSEVPVDTAYWAADPRPHPPGTPLRVAFVADDQPRKGLRVLLDAVSLLPPGTVVLDVVGPHDRHADALRAVGARTHGWLEPEPLRDVLQQCHVIASPVTRDRVEDGYGDPGMVDGFPTTAGLLGLLAGCALVSGNPEQDHTRLRPGTDYVEVPERDPRALAAALLALGDDPARREGLARHGAATGHATWSAPAVVGARLAHMGLS